MYAVLHDPKYRQKYEINLKRDFPRIPFYTDFEKWVAWGKTLMDLHINYEHAAPYPLTEKSIEKEKPKAKLKAIKENGEIVIDESTSLMGVPLEAYNYKLGNRSAIEWVLDQYKESKPTDPTIREKFNTYKFADYKTHVIDLLKRVCTVSMETIKIVAEMAKGYGYREIYKKRLLLKVAVFFLPHTMKDKKKCYPQKGMFFQYKPICMQTKKHLQVFNL